jgi:hypothetical protein
MGGVTMADPEARATARQHTARLLKMLRGYGPASESEPATSTTEPDPTVVAEAAPAYARLLEVAPDRPLPAARPSSSPPPAAPRAPPPPPGPVAADPVIPTVGEVLRHQPGVLGQLLAQHARLAQSSQIFHAYLPPHLRDHAILVRMDQDGWEVQTDSAGWATRLRYALPSIRQGLSQHLGIPLPKPRIRIVPDARPPTPRRPPLTLTERNARLLKTAAQDLGDTRLSAALRRLAEHSQPHQAP